MYSSTSGQYLSRRPSVLAAADAHISLHSALCLCSCSAATVFALGSVQAVVYAEGDALRLFVNKLVYIIITVR